jgi:hypothetical protein
MLAGDIPSAGTDWLAIMDALHALSDTWTDYSPSLTWTSSGTAPALGNATVDAKYVLVNKFAAVRYQIVFGSTSTFGTGAWIFSLPFTTLGQSGTLGVFALHAGTSAPYAGSAWVGADAATNFRVTFGTVAAYGGATSPFTWASTDRIIMTGVVPVA